MNLKPLVSIGVPTYNRPLGLKRTLKCLVNQTYTNIEIVVSDNCSTNSEVEEIVNEFLSDHRIKYFKQPVNKGAVVNFQFALEKSTGEYFKFLADDDWVDYNYVESCLKFLFQNPEYSTAYGVGNLCTNDGNFFDFDTKLNLDDCNPATRLKKYYGGVRNNSTYYGLFKRELVIKNFSFATTIALDWIVIARIIFIGKGKLITNTNSYISIDGISSEMDVLTASFNMPVFTRSYPDLTIALNAFRDIFWGSDVYKKYPFFKRLNLAFKCFFIIYKKRSVGKQLKSGTKKFIKYQLGILKR